jgi:uncharacterized protein (TIGR03437 family)
MKPFSALLSSRLIAQPDFGWGLLFTFGLLLTCVWAWPGRATGQGAANEVTTASAASFTLTLAPDSIAAAFGTRLATRTDVATTLPLPTTLAGTTVKVNGELARLFFVSAGQVNYLIPPGTPQGIASVEVTASDRTISTGIVQIAPAAPALFTANGAGRGPLAADLLRVKADGQQLYEPLAQYNGAEFVTRPIDFGPESDQLFLVLYLTGVRQAAPGSVRVSIGGVEYAPQFVGPASFAGLDQINVVLPRDFSGRGRITLLVKADGYGASNAAEFEIGSGTQPPDLAPLQLTRLSREPVLAGEVVEISGTGFAANPRENAVQVVAPGSLPANAEVLAVSVDTLRIGVPFGAGTGQIKVSRGKSEASLPIQVRTSLSGFIQEVRRQQNEQIERVGVKDINVRVVGGNSAMSHDPDGSFVIPDVTEGQEVVFLVNGELVEGRLVPVNSAYSAELRKMPVIAKRDNQYRGDRLELANIIELRRANGPTLSVNQGTVAQTSLSATVPADTHAPAGSIETGQVIFEVPDNAVIRFPGGATSGGITLTVLDRGRTPANLPVTHFSSTIAQLTPFGTTITPGGKLTFPNTDNLPPGSKARLFKFDQRVGSLTLGAFIDISNQVGEATVSADGRRIETAPGAITETSYYFVSVARPTARINGRVVESDGRPVPRAVVQVRGQSTFTDGFGGFVLHGVPVLKARGDRVRVEVNYQRPDGRVARKDSSEVELIADALVTVSPDIVLDPVVTNFPPVILAPTSLTLQAGETREFELAVADPDSAQAPQFSLSGGTAFSFATLLNSQSAGSYRLRLAPGANAAGNYTLSLRAIDSAGAPATQSIAVIVNANSNAPVAQTQAITTPEDMAKQITLTGRNPGGQALSYTIVSRPTRGSLSGDEQNRVYTPASNFNGTDSFTFKVSNGSAESAAATVFIAVTPVNDAPVLNVPTLLTVSAGETLNLVVTATDIDGDRSLRFTVTDLPPGATFIGAGGTNWLLSWTPTITQAGTFIVSITVTDSSLPPGSDTKQLTIRVGARWAKTSGPEGGTVIALLGANGILYAGTGGGGVYRSNDNGKSWAAVSNGLSGGALEVRALHASGGDLFAGTDAGIYRSTNNGQSWVAANNGLGNSGSIYEFYSVGNTLLASKAGNGVYRSTDNGQSWIASNNGFPNNNLTIFVFYSLNNVLLVGTTQGVYRSTDSGRSWMAANNGLPVFELGYGISALAASGNNLLAASQFRLYRSTDGGQSWTAIENGPGEVTGFYASGNLLFAITFIGGVLRSTDNGQTFVAVNRGLSLSSLSFYALTAANNTLFIGTRNGIYYSTDNALNWQASGPGITASFNETLVYTGGKLFAPGRRLNVTVDNGQSWNVIDSPAVLSNIQALYSIGSNLFAASDSEVFRSSNNGQSWIAASNGLPGERIYPLYAAGSSLFAGTNGGGVFRTTDNGQSWTAVNNGLAGRALIISAFQAIGNSLFAGTFSGIYRSSDNGQNWTAVNNGIPNPASVSALHAIGNNLFAIVGNDVYRSSDSGQNWVAVNNGLPTPRFSLSRLYSLGNNLFVGSFGGGIYRSSDNGQNWVVVNNGLSGEALQIAALYALGNTLYAGTAAGVYRSANNGANWNAVNNGLPPDAPYISTLHAIGGNLFAGGQGVFRMADGGQNWVVASNGLPAQPLATTTVLALNDSLFVGTVNGIYRSTNSGANWSKVNNGLAGDGFRVHALIALGNTLFAGTEGGVYRSTDNGLNWTALNQGLADTPLVSKTLYASGNTLFIGSYGRGVYRSTDNGQNWVTTNAGLSGDALRINTLHALGNNLFVGTGSGVFHSPDNGQSWLAANKGLDANSDIAALHSLDNNLFAATRNGVYRSPDNGQNWALFSEALTNQVVLSLVSNGKQLFASTSGYGVFLLSNNTQDWSEINTNLPLTSRFANAIASSTENLYLGTLGNGIFRSSLRSQNEQGRSWSSASIGLPPNVNIQSIIVSNTTIWVATFGGGVYRSTNQGANWTAANAGLGNLFVNELFLSGSTLYAGTDGGVFRSTDGSSWTSSGLTDLRVISFALMNGVLYAGTDGSGVFRLNGSSWQAVNRGLSSLSVSALGVQGTLLYAGTRDGGICLSRDGGANWTPVNNQLPPTLPIFAFAVSGKKVYAGSIYGVFLTEDEGQTWKQLNAGLLNTFVTGLAVSGDQLFASTASGGVFVSRIPIP